MTELVTVKKVKRGYAYIELERSEKCEGCALCSFNNRTKMTALAVCDIKVSPGDKVTVEMPTKPVGAASLLIYAIPLITVLVGALIGLVGDMWLQVGLAAAGLVTGLAAAWLIDRHYRKKEGVLPRVTAVCGKKDSEQTDRTPEEE